MKRFIVWLVSVLDLDGRQARAERCARRREMVNVRLKEREPDPLEKMGYRKK